MLQEETIPPKGVSAFKVKRDQFLRVTDIEGQQVGDLALLNEHDLTDKFCPSYTREHTAIFDPETMLVASKLRGFTVGDELISTVRHVMATITADTPTPAGVHDITMRSCARWVYEQAAREGLGVAQDGCFELLSRALSPHGVEPGNLPDAFNLFMNVAYDPSTERLGIVEPVSNPGDYIELRAEMDLLCALSACPDDSCSMCNGKAPHRAKPLKVQIFEDS
jgi:hypothetical protein